MTETVKIALPKQTWTEIASGHANVTARTERKAVVRLYVGPSAPTGVVGVPIERGELIPLGSLGVSDKVFMYAPDADNAAWVVRG